MNDPDLKIDEPSMAREISAELSGRDSISLSLVQGKVERAQIIGCSFFLNLLREQREKFGPVISEWIPPTGNSHQAILVRELIAKAKGTWDLPYPHAEICHCRNVTTQKVDQAIIAGAQTPELVSRLTGASTACGTCRNDIISIIRYRTTD